MELKFNSIDEIISFLTEIGYEVNKKCCGKCKEENTGEGTLTKEIDEDWWKKIPQNPYPYSPTNPYTPWYPNYPIVTYDAMSDPHLSSKFPKCSK